MEDEFSVSQATVLLQECDHSPVSAHHLSVNDEKHLPRVPRGFTDAALLGQTLRQILDA